MEAKKKSCKKTSTLSKLSGVEFIVEKILDKRFVDGKPQYLLKWKGYDDAHNSWEPFENVDGLVILPEFERQFEENKKRNKRQENSLLREESGSLQSALVEAPVQGNKNTRSQAKMSKAGPSKPAENDAVNSFNIAQYN